MLSSLKDIIEDVNCTTANRVSASRILMLPFFITYHCLGQYDIAFAIAFYMVISDMIDGYIARLYKETSEFGKILDPIADKTVTFGLFGTLVASMYYLLSRPIWWSIIKASMLLLISEIFLLIIGYWAAKKGVHGGSNLGGKAKMITESYIFLYGYYFLYLSPTDFNKIGRSINSLLWFAIALSLASIMIHLWGYRPVYRRFKIISSR